MDMPKSRKTRKVLRPINNQVLVRHDKDQDESAGGILLPDSAKIHVATGVILAVSSRMTENQHDYPFKEGDRIVYNLDRRQPYNSDRRDRHFLIDADDILAVEEEEEIPDEVQDAN